MEFRILGRIEAHEGERPVAIAGAKQQLLLALLLAASGRRVSRDALIEALWPDRPPGGSGHALELQVARLRRAIGADRVVTEAGGYRIELGDAALDADRFDALVEEAAAEPPAAAAPRLREALDLWRGPAFGDLGCEEALRSAARALEDRRTGALEAWFENELALGRQGAILGELQAAATEHPLRERVHEQLMLALYRCGRQSEALRTYDELRRRLVEELGIDPGASARRLHEQIVRQDPALASRPAVEPRARPATRNRRRLRWALAGALATAGVAALGVGLVGDHSRADPPAPVGGFIDARVPESHLAFVDVRTGRVLASRPIGAEIGPDANADLTPGRSIDWLATASGVLLQLDPRRHAVVRSISLGFPLRSVAVGLGSVWVIAADRPLLVRLDPAFGTVMRRYRVPRAGIRHPEILDGVAVAAGSVWVAQGEERVIRMDPRTGAARATIAAPGASALAGSDGAVWVAGGDTGVLYRIDPVADAVVTRVRLDPYLCCVAIGGGYAWAMNYRVWKLTADGHVVSSIPIRGDGAQLTWTGDAMWVAEGVSGRATLIRPADDATRTVRTGGLLLDASLHGDVATVVTAPAPENLLAGVRGPVARIELGSDALHPDDPALQAPARQLPWREQLLDATCARLVTLRAAPAPQGWSVVPEISDPPSTADRRTWTFRIRPGFRFSPPSGAPVTAASMRWTVERALSPRMGTRAAAPPILDDVVGLADFRSGRTAHVRGLEVHGDRLVVRVRRPAADLPLRMASPAFCAVPDRTPASPTRFFGTPIPSAGPYYLARHLGGNAAVVRRNPNYRGSRPQRFAAFLYEMAVQAPVRIDRVAQGRADLVADTRDALRAGSAVARPFGRDGAGARWSRRTLPATHLLRVHTGAGALGDARIRRAVDLALDRRAMAVLFDDQPTTRALPPGVAGSAPAVAVPAPDPQRARALIAGRTVRLVLGGCGSGATCRAFGALVRKSLGRAGISVAVQPNARDADLTFRRVTMRAPDPLGFLEEVGGPAAPSPRPAPERTAVLAAAVDARLARTSVVLAFGTPTVDQLASARLGCRRPLPLTFGDDLAALCPR